MNTNQLVPCLNFLVQQLSDLMDETSMWPRRAQADLYTFWSQLDYMTLLLELSPMPITDIHGSLSEIWLRLEVLEQAFLEGKALCHLDRIHQVLTYVSYILDDSLGCCLELSPQALSNISSIGQLIDNLIEERRDDV
jgi:hypothetical protein